MKRALAVFVVAVVGCRPATMANHLTDATRLEVRDSVKAGLQGYAAAVTSLDSTRIVSYFTTDTSLRIALRRTVIGLREVHAWAGSLKRTNRGFRVTFGLDSVAVTVLSPSTASALVSFTNLVTDTAGAVTTQHGTSTWVWTKTDAGWRIGAAHSVGDPPIAMRP